MILTDFTIDLNDPKQQPVLAFSSSQNAFLILAEFIKHDGKKDYFSQAQFIIYHLNYNRYYNIIENVEFVPADPNDPDTKHSFYICLDINKKPNFKMYPVDLSANGLHIPSGTEIRIHLDYSDDCGNGVINSGNWPCNKVKAM